jgi:hypothetical protein
MAKAKKTIKTQKGDHKMEFYAALDDIKNLYTNKGFVIYKRLYEHLKLQKKWKMSYVTFCIYASRELAIGKPNEPRLSDMPIEQSSQEPPPKKEDEPIIAKANFGSGTRFNPHTIDLPDERKL